jgi:hypothetical protein
MGLEELERKIKAVQDMQLRCFHDAWIEEYETRRMVRRVAEKLEDIDRRLSKLEKDVDQHQRLGDFCPHTQC